MKLRIPAINRQKIIRVLDVGTDILFTQRYALWLYALYVAWRIAKSAFKSWPTNTYSWSELFINYEGGFIRRGFLGQVLYECADWINPQILGTIIFLVCLTLVFFLCWRKLSTWFDPVVCWLVLLSPALLLFHVKDYDMFARKDLVILSCVMGMMCAARKAVGQRASVVYLLTAVLVALHSFAFLTHEMAIFFFPPAFLLMGAAYAKLEKLRLWFLIGLVVELTSLYLAARYAGTVTQRDAIYASWLPLFPDLQLHGSIAYIGREFSTWTTEVRTLLSDPVTVFTTLLAFVLASLPFWVLSIAYKSVRAAKTVFSSTFLRLLLVPALLSPFLLMTFAQDFGRFISAGLLTTLFFLTALQQLAPHPTPPVMPRLCEAMRRTWKRRTAFFAVVLLYSFGWTLSHSSSGSIIRPTALIKYLLKLF